MRRGLVRLALAAAFGVWLVGVGPVRSAGPGPERVVTALAVGVATVPGDASVDEGRRLAHVDTLTAGAFDLERSARIALGRHWRSAAEEERREFAELFRDYVLTSYGRRFHQYADRTFRVAGGTPTDDGAVVESYVEGGTTPIRLDWRLVASEAGWRVLDVAVEGVSLLVTFRNEFAAVIERSGGRIAGLLDELRQRVAAERAQLAG